MQTKYFKNAGIAIIKLVVVFVPMVWLLASVRSEMYFFLMGVAISAIPLAHELYFIYSDKSNDRFARNMALISFAILVIMFVVVVIFLVLQPNIVLIPQIVSVSLFMIGVSLFYLVETIRVIRDEFCPKKKIKNSATGQSNNEDHSDLNFSSASDN